MFLKDNGSPVLVENGESTRFQKCGKWKYSLGSYFINNPILVIVSWAFEAKMLCTHCTANRNDSQILKAHIYAFNNGIPVISIKTILYDIFTYNKV